MISYSDADWGSDLDERKSTFGYAFLLNNGAITWSSKKQPCIALSTMEAEYVACSAVVQEAVWLRRFFQNLEVVKDASDPVTIPLQYIVIAWQHLPMLKILSIMVEPNTLIYDITTFNTWLLIMKWF